MTDETEQQPDSLLPYDRWRDDAMRHVMLRALAYAGTNGLPGEHHYYLTFRTDLPGVEIPDRLRAQYPHEMTIVLQHQFWDLVVDEVRRMISVGLSFGGVPSILRIPFGVVTQFFDPHVRFGLRFEVDTADMMPMTTAPVASLVVVPSQDDAEDAAPSEEPVSQDDNEGTPGEPEKPPEEAEIVSLDAFRRRPPNRDS